MKMMTVNISFYISVLFHDSLAMLSTDGNVFSDSLCVKIV